MNVNLLLITLIIFSCIFFNKISFRFGIPTLFVFILLGMAFGSDGFARISFDNFALSETVCSVALIFIMFYGGFGTNWKMHTAVDGGRVSDRSLSRALPLSLASARTLALLFDRFRACQHGRSLCLLCAALPETGLKREHGFHPGA